MVDNFEETTMVANDEIATSENESNAELFIPLLFWQLPDIRVNEPVYIPVNSELPLSPVLDEETQLTSDIISDDSWSTCSSESIESIDTVEGLSGTGLVLDDAPLRTGVD